MNGVSARGDESIERLLRRFSKICESAGVLSDMKEYRHYEKPSEERKRKLNIAKRRRMQQYNRER